jgi:predicted nucleic acid-binding protein
VIVVDSSAAVEMLLHTAAGERCLESLRTARPAVVPAHFDVEVYAVIRRMYLHRELGRGSLDALVAQLSKLDAERVDLKSLLPSVVQLVDVIGSYDVFYVLLAISRRCSLLTCDLPLARAAARLGVDVIAIDRARPS